MLYPVVASSDLRHRLPLLLILGASLALSLTLVMGRVLLTQQLKFVFLLWNLFLAAIPFALSSLLAVAKGPLRARVLLPVPPGAAHIMHAPVPHACEPAPPPCLPLRHVRQAHGLGPALFWPSWGQMLSLALGLALASAHPARFVPGTPADCRWASWSTRPG